MTALKLEKKGSVKHLSSREIWLNAFGFLASYDLSYKLYLALVV